MSKNPEHRKKERYESDSEDEKFEEMRMYKKFKKMLLCDPELMLTGIDVIADVYNTAAQTIPVGGIITYEYNDTLLNVDHVPNTGEIVLKKDGLFMIQFAVNTTDPCQFTLFVNGIPHAASTTGINTGATQFFSVHLLALKVGDILTV